MTMEAKQEIITCMKIRRKELDLSYQELADKTGISKSTLQRYETGRIAKIPVEKAKIIAKALDISPEQLMGIKSKSEPSAEFINVYNIPVFDSVSAGFGCYADSNVSGYKPTYLSNVAEAGDFLWINVKGDSMSPTIDNGDTILVHRQDSVENGSVAVVMIDEDAFVKKVKYGKGWVELHSFNPYYPVRRFEKAEAENIRIVGVVKEVCKKL